MRDIPSRGRRFLRLPPFAYMGSFHGEFGQRHIQGQWVRFTTLPTPPPTAGGMEIWKTASAEVLGRRRYGSVAHGCMGACAIGGHIGAERVRGLWKGWLCARGRWVHRYGSVAVGTRCHRVGSRAAPVPPPRAAQGRRGRGGGGHMEAVPCWARIGRRYRPYGAIGLRLRAQRFKTCPVDVGRGGLLLRICRSRPLGSAARVPSVPSAHSASADVRRHVNRRCAEGRRSRERKG